jgi:hypothetical protein
MGSHRLRGALVLACLVVGPPGLRAGLFTRASSPPDNVAALAARIDDLIGAGYAARKATPAAPADDAEFVRRVYLDLAGRIPRFSEVRDFLADRSPGKRRKLVEHLLDGPHYVNHFTRVWRALLLPQNNNQQVQFFARQMESWVRAQLQGNAPYDRMVRDLLTADAVFNGGYDPARVAAAFYQANEFKPENLAAATSRIFLGVKLECAQCHDHPFGAWKRTQFWEYTAFFGGIKERQGRAGPFSPTDNPEVHEIQIPGTERTVQARFLDGARPEWKPKVRARARLAEWMTAADNPYFARAAANRLWAHFFGIGIVEPVDDLGTENAPSHPELLDELARAFVKSGFDPKFLIRAITASRTYQLTSAGGPPGPDDPRRFARMALKGLTAEQVFDSLATATGYREGQVAMLPNGFTRVPSARAEFLARFANASDKRTEHQTSILQALSLMNGRFVADATSLERSETLAAVLDSPFMDNRQRLDTIFLTVLSRPMRPGEAVRLMPYVEKGGPSGNPRKALADVFWVLLNSSEFILNH